MAAVLGDGRVSVHTLDVRIANKGTGARFHVEIDDVDRTGSISVPDTDRLRTYQTLMFDAGTAEDGGVGNVNRLRFVSP